MLLNMKIERTGEKAGPWSHDWIRLSCALSNTASMPVTFLFKLQRLLFEEITALLKGH